MNQFKLTFQLEKPFVPKKIDALIISFLKAATQNYSEQFYNSLYDKRKSITKTYTFSYYLPGAKFEKQQISLGTSSFEVCFSDADLGESILFLNAFKIMQGKDYPMHCNSMKLTSIIPQKRQQIRDCELVIKMSSSLIVRKHNVENNSDTYFTYDQEGFSEALQENISFLLSKLKLSISIENFSITPIKAKKVVQNVFDHMVDANIGVYKITGNLELLNFLYLAGMGARRSSGHGKWEIIL